MMRKCLAIGIILLFVGISSIPNTCGNIDEKKNGFFELNKPSSVNETITDYIGDVISIDYFTGEATIVTNSTDIEVVNLDIIQATYTQQDVQVFLSLQVVGLIENRGELLDLYGNFTDIDAVEYDFQLTTSEQDYMISYCNQTGKLIYDDVELNLTSSDFSVVGDKLSIWLPLLSAEEIYETLSVTSTYIKFNFSEDPEDLVYFSDVAPNPPLEININAPNIGFVGESIQFDAFVYPLTGTPPYIYHWNFGDQGISIELDPTHVYTKAGVYLYTFMVTDRAGTTAYDSGFITIYELKKTFIFGRYTNWTTEDGLTTIDAARLWTLQFKQFKLELITPPDTITFSDDWVGLKIKQFIVGFFEVVTL